MHIMYSLVHSRNLLQGLIQIGILPYVPQCQYAVQGDGIILLIIICIANVRWQKMISPDPHISHVSMKFQFELIHLLIFINRLILIDNILDDQVPVEVQQVLYKSGNPDKYVMKIQKYIK